jgi:hypothetical protein
LINNKPPHLLFLLSSRAALINPLINRLFFFLGDRLFPRLHFYLSAAPGTALCLRLRGRPGRRQAAVAAAEAGGGVVNKKFLGFHAAPVALAFWPLPFLPFRWFSGVGFCAGSGWV